MQKNVKNRILDYVRYDSYSNALRNDRNQILEYVGDQIWKQVLDQIDQIPNRVFWQVQRQINAEER